jgi:hypothetical protein
MTISLDGKTGSQGVKEWDEMRLGQQSRQDARRGGEPLRPGSGGTPAVGQHGHGDQLRRHMIRPAANPPANPGDAPPSSRCCAGERTSPTLWPTDLSEAACFFRVVKRPTLLSSSHTTFLPALSADCMGDFSRQDSHAGRKALPSQVTERPRRNRRGAAPPPGARADAAWPWSGFAKRAIRPRRAPARFPSW